MDIRRSRFDKKVASADPKGVSYTALRRAGTLRPLRNSAPLREINIQFCGRRFTHADLLHSALNLPSLPLRERKTWLGNSLPSQSCEGAATFAEKLILRNHPLQLRLGAKAPSLHILSRQGRGGGSARQWHLGIEVELSAALPEFQLSAVPP